MAKTVSLVSELDDEAQAIAEVIEAGRNAAVRRWVPATSGNFSVRIDAERIAITRSGVDKGALQPSDILIQPLGEPLLPRSSAEASLHTSLYRGRPDIGAIFHVHSPAASVLSRLAEAEGRVILHGWELQKALSGVTTHEASVEVPVFANEQDTHSLAMKVEARLAIPSDFHPAPGYLLAGHGLYAFGSTAIEAARHLEALETLFDLELSIRRFTP